MKRLFAVAVVCLSVGLILGFHLRGGSPAAHAGGVAPTCSSKNGDVNADGTIDLSDATTVLGFLFLGLPGEILPLCPPEPVTCHLPAPGRTPGRFLDNGDGTATDTITGLMWQRETAPGLYKWQAAIDYCVNLELAGHTDWRLPNIRELESLFDYENVAVVDPLFSLVIHDGYWSSTAKAADWVNFAYALKFDLGEHIRILDFQKDDPSLPIRAVRTLP